MRRTVQLGHPGFVWAVRKRGGWVVHNGLLAESVVAEGVTEKQADALIVRELNRIAEGIDVRLRHTEIGSRPIHRTS